MSMNYVYHDIFHTKRSELNHWPLRFFSPPNSKCLVLRLASEINTHETNRNIFVIPDYSTCRQCTPASSPDSWWSRPSSSIWAYTEHQILAAYYHTFHIGRKLCKVSINQLVLRLFSKKYETYISIPFCTKTRLKSKVFSLEILMLLLWTNILRTNDAWTDVVVTVVICFKCSRTPCLKFDPNRASNS